MHSRKRTLLLVNPGAGRGEETLAPVIDRFRRSGLQVTLENFEALPALRQDIDRLRSTHDQMVICGGDGSISSAAGAVMESGLPMGILPMGTANDLARTLQIPLELEEAAGVILAGRLRPIDVGTVNGHTFFNIASIGLSTELARRLDARMKRRFGRLSYALTAIQVLLSARRFRARIAANGHSRTVKTYQIAVGNGVHYGGGNVISQAAAIRRRSPGPLQPRDAQLVEAGPYVSSLPGGPSWGLEGSPHGPQRRVRDRNPPPAPGQRGRRDRYDHAGAFQNPSGSRVRVRALTTPLPFPGNWSANILPNAYNDNCQILFFRKPLRKEQACAPPRLSLLPSATEISEPYGWRA